MLYSFSQKWSLTIKKACGSIKQMKIKVICKLLFNIVKESFLQPNRVTIISKETGNIVEKGICPFCGAEGIYAVCEEGMWKGKKKLVCPKENRYPTLHELLVDERKVIEYAQNKIEQIKQEM